MQPVLCKSSASILGVSQKSDFLQTEFLCWEVTFCSLSFLEQRYLRRTVDAVSDNGVLGVVQGITGAFPALEAIKLASELGETLNSRMLLLDALSTRIHMVRLRGRNAECVSCGDVPQILASDLWNYDFERFTQSILPEEVPYISSLSNSLNIPLSILKEKLPVLRSALLDSSGKLWIGDHIVQTELLLQGVNEDSAFEVTTFNVVNEHHIGVDQCGAARIRYLLVPDVRKEAKLSVEENATMHSYCFDIIRRNKSMTAGDDRRLGTGVLQLKSGVDFHEVGTPGALRITTTSQEHNR
ncbi:hypothetical protein R1flu_028702 [Riccia fluitans]|uniref:Uncharacterized protein n=1 Tax=Riccia fluitans TaxID=41844 RepID=A0ABD1XMG4_9MARC